MKNKNVEPKYIVVANPWLNPTELVFNVIIIKNYVKAKNQRQKKN